VYGQLVATIPSKRVLPKHWTHGRGDEKPSKLMNERGFRFGGTVQKSQDRSGYSLWMRGIELIGLHYRVIRALKRNAVDRNVGITAPKMTAEAAERWRQNYKEYRQRKHAGRKQATQNGTKSMPLLSLDSSKLEPSLSRKHRSMGTTEKDQDPKPMIDKKERKLHHKIKAIAKPRSTQRHLSQPEGDTQQKPDQIAVQMDGDFEAPHVNFHVGKENGNGKGVKEVP
uniref:Uncharacterized protein n=1 Tax=Acrobeloides nanus TaxID=290746 RepID=A0A914DMS1_9BILA